MNATASDAADNLAKATRDAAADFRQRRRESRDFMSEELRALIADVEELLRKIANISDVEVARLRAKVSSALGDVRRTASDTANDLRARARAAVSATDDYVRDRPWAAIGVAAGLGLLIGVSVTAISRRS